MGTMLSNVRKGKIIKPVLILIYGPGGIGKSTWGAKTPNPIFLGAEDGTDLLDVVRLPMPRNYEDINQCLKELLEEEHDYKTLVVDSLDWVEPLIWNAICRRYNKQSIELAAGGYGKGYLEAAEEWVNLLGKFSALRDHRGMNIVLLAHPEVRTHTNPHTQATYQRYELKLHKQSKAKIMEYVDAIFFASFEMFSSKVGDEIKSVASKNRVLQGVPNQFDGYDAKNRYGLTEPVSMSASWDDFISLCDVKPYASLVELGTEIDRLLALISDEDIKSKAVDAISKAGDNQAQLTKICNRLKVVTEGVKK
jgi:hypothetical protein